MISKKKSVVKATALKTVTPNTVAQTIKKTFNWQKLLGMVGLVALFICGLMIGLFYSNESQMSEKQCRGLLNQIEMESDIFVRDNLINEFNINCLHASKPANIHINNNIESDRNCVKVEKLLNEQMNQNAGNVNSVNSADHLYRAQYYVNLGERGCLENAESYKQLALNEIELARALADDKFYEEYEVEYVIDVYKKLNMKKEAEQVFNKIKKMTNPAIDFILQIEKIINE